MGFGLWFQASWKGYKQRRVYKDRLKTFQDSVRSVIKVTVLIADAHLLQHFIIFFLVALKCSMHNMKTCFLYNLVTVNGEDVES